MAINASGAVAVPLTVFGSWVTEVSPNAVPENISPDCQDNSYAPGGVGSRPCLNKIFSPAFPAGGPNNYIPTFTGAFSYELPTGQIQNLYYDSNGILWIEYFSITPGVYTQLFQSTPGTYARFTGTFGRVYIAISDGLHGQEVPLQWDGTRLRRFTQGGPANPPTVTPIAYPAVSVAAIPAASTTVTVATTTGESGGLYYTLMVTVASTAGFAEGQYIQIASNSNSILNQAYIISAVVSPTVLQLIYSDFGGAFETGTGGTLGTLTSSSLTRGRNIVTVNTAAAHNLKVGYQALLQGNGILNVGTSISSITINNEENPGLALVTTGTPHGLVPGNDVTITGVSPVAVGGTWSASWDGSTTVMTSSVPHGLVPGGVITISGGSGGGAVFNTSVTVALVPSPTSISFAAAYLGTPPLTASGLTLTLSWPIPDDTPDPTYFEVEEVPTPTTFQVQVTYCDGTWANGYVGFAWDGTFYVATVPSPTSFTYLQYGPNGTTNETAGTVTPFGQMAPGLHLVAVAYLTDQGAITAPSVFGTFIANGGQYLSISNLLPGPTNIVARIIMFTGAQPNVPGELPPFFYIPATPQLEGQIVGTATQINDNTTTSVILDFADNTLYAAIGVSVPGNNIANQIVLDGALGFGDYTSRLTAWGQRNTVQNFLNMGFDADAAAATNPQGWTTQGLSFSGMTVSLASRPAGSQWQFVNSALPQNLLQSAYEDCYGDPILNSNQTYKIRLWIGGSGANVPSGPDFFAKLSSGVTGFSTLATISNSVMSSQGSFLEAVFAGPTPTPIPADLVLTIGVSTGSGTLNVVADEISIIPIQTPFTDQLAYASYINNPEGMDGDSGQFGANDPSKLMDMAELRDTLYLLTQAPTGRLHETNGSGQTEPDGWDVAEVAANCGVLSAFGLTHSQADDAAASGGDDWMAWPSDSGAYIFGGGLPEKISQEIQPNWNPAGANYPWVPASAAINFAAATTAWGLCDPVARLLFFGIPTGTATAPNKIYVLDFKNLGSAQAIAGSPPFHPSFSGKLIATDNSRKWTPWNMTMNGAARMYRSDGQLTTVFFGGNGLMPGASASYGNLYTLNPNLLTDDDYGRVYPYYTTYFFIDPEKAQALGLKGTRVLMSYLQAYIQGVGQVTATYFPDDLRNPWSLNTVRTLTPNFFKDRQFGGGMCTGDRIAVKFASSPITGTDNSFLMSRLTAYVKDARLKVSGVNQ
jgi:hypothetical protein